MQSLLFYPKGCDRLLADKLRKVFLQIEIEPVHKTMRKVLFARHSERGRELESSLSLVKIESHGNKSAKLQITKSRAKFLKTIILGWSACRLYSLLQDNGKSIVRQVQRPITLLSSCASLNSRVMRICKLIGRIVDCLFTGFNHLQHTSKIGQSILLLILSNLRI